MADPVPSTSAAAVLPLKNEDVISAFHRNGENFRTTIQFVYDMFIRHGYNCSFSGVDLKVRRLVKDYKSKKQRKRDASKLVALLNSVFTVPSCGQSKVKSNEHAQMSAAADSASLTLRGDCERCPGVREEQKTVVTGLKSRYTRLWKAKTAVSQEMNARLVRFKIKRKNMSLARVSEEVRHLKRDKKLLERRVKDLEIVENKLKYIQMLKNEQRKRKNAEITIRMLTGKVKMLEEDLRKDRARVIDLENEVMVEKDKKMEVDMRDTCKKKYGNSMRLTVFKCLLSHVPVERTGDLILFISKIINDKDLSSAPGPSTVSRMAHELGVLSDLQTGEAIYLSDNTTLAWDATSIAGTHVNEIHVITPFKTLYLQVGHLPGGTTSDYYHHIADTLKGIATSYASYIGLEMEDVLYRFYESICCTLTDRAAVNHCVTAELSLLLNKDLIELNCNVHPLDGLASSTRKAICSRDKLTGTLSNVYGKDCRAANMIMAVSKLRYKAGAGDPSGFKLFLQRCGLKEGIIPRYVGNRLHILFHSAGIIYHHRDSLVVYLSKYCSSTQLRLCLLGDFRSEEIMSQIRVLGLFGKVLTGPWMKLFYKNSAKKKHLEMIPYMRCCVGKLEEIVRDPHMLLNTPRDVFDEPLEVDDNVHQSLLSPAVTESFSSIISCVSSAMLATLKRQLEPYLQGRLSNPTQEMLDKTSSAPLNNIASERALGMFDALSRRAPNASVGFVDSKVKAAMNHTLKYVLDKGEIIQHHLLHFATKRANDIRLARKATQRQSVATAQQRQVEKAQARDSKGRRKVEKELKNFISKGDNQSILDQVDDTSAHEFVVSILQMEVPRSSFQHVWDVNGDEVTFNGTVTEMKVVKKVSFAVVQYQGSGESSVTVSELLTDLIMGDLTPSVT